MSDLEGEARQLAQRLDALGEKIVVKPVGGPPFRRARSRLYYSISTKYAHPDWIRGQSIICDPIKDLASKREKEGRDDRSPLVMFTAPCRRLPLCTT